MRAPLASILVTSCIVLAFGKLVLNPGSLLIDEQRALSIGNDQTRLYLPLHTRIARAIHATGRIPGWDPSGFGGRPLVGNPQAGLWYPPIWLFWCVPAPQLIGWLTLAHLVFCGLGALGLARRAGASLAAAVPAAVFAAINPYLMAHVLEGHDPHVWAAAWYPWAFWAALAARAGHRGATLALPITLAMSLSAGHPQPGFLLYIAIGAWGVFDLVRKALDPMRCPQSWRAALILPGACVVALLLTAIEWVPVALARPWTTTDSRMALADTTAYSLDLTSFQAMITPLFFQQPPSPPYLEVTLRLGIMPALLVLPCVVLATRVAAARGWVLLAAVTVIFAFGGRLGLFTLLYHAVPGFSAMRVPARALFLTMIAGAMLIALATQSLARHPRLRNALGVLLVFELLVSAWMQIPVMPAQTLAHANPLDRAVINNLKNEHLRVRYSDQTRAEFASANAGLELTDLYDWFQLEHAARLYRLLYGISGLPRPIDALDPLASWHRAARQRAVLDRMGVAWIVDGRHALPHATALPRAYVVGGVQRARIDADALEWMTWTDPKQAVVMTHDPLHGAPRRQAFTPARYIPVSNDLVEIDVETWAPGLLVVGDTWMPGWRATVNGQAVPILRGNHAQRVVVLDKPGRHQIVMRYNTPGLEVAAATSAAAWSLWLAIAITITTSRKHKRRISSCVPEASARDPVKPTHAACAATTRP